MPKRSRSNTTPKKRRNVKKVRLLATPKKHFRTGPRPNKRRRKLFGPKRRTGLYQKAIKNQGSSWSFTRLYGAKRPAFWRISNRQISSNAYLLNNSGYKKFGSPSQDVWNITRWGTASVLIQLREYITNNSPLTTFFLYSCHIETTITNMSNNPTKIWLYDYGYKKDLPAAGDTYFPDTCLAAGATEVNAVITDVGQSPFQIPMFTRNYHVYKISELLLTPGESHIHRVMCIYNKMVKPDELYWSGTTTALGAMKKYTRGTFAIAHGGLVWDNVNNIVAPGNSELGYLTKHTYKYSWTNDNIFTTHRSNTLSTIAINNQHLMNTDTSADVALDILGPNA